MSEQRQDIANIVMRAFGSMPQPATWRDREKTSYALADAILGLIQKEQGWRPMSEAPKDGTHILAQIESLDQPLQVVVFWSPDGGGKWPWRVVPDGDRWNSDFVKAWQPLPTPPQGEDAK